MAAASHDELLAVHEEFLTLVRAGLPLDHGMREFARDVPGRMRPLLSDLADKLAQGQDVSAALAGVSSPSARIYAAVLAVGIKAGRPAAALEGIVSTARRSIGYRQAMLAEMVYPVLVLLLGAVLIAFSISHIAPVHVRANQQFDVEGPLATGVQQVAGQPSGILIVLAGLAGLGILWLVPRFVGASPLSGGTSWRPLRTIRQWQSLAIFYDHLALLVENHVPLPQAISLASEAAASPPLAKAGQALAQRISQGETKPGVDRPLPPALGWLLQRPSAATLPQAMRREAEHSRRRCDRLQRWYSLYFPTLITFAVGLTCLVVLAAINLAPLVNLYYRLSASSP